MNIAPKKFQTRDLRREQSLKSQVLPISLVLHTVVKFFRFKLKTPFIRGWISMRILGLQMRQVKFSVNRLKRKSIYISNVLISFIYHHGRTQYSSLPHRKMYSLAVFTSQQTKQFQQPTRVFKVPVQGGGGICNKRV